MSSDRPDLPLSESEPAAALYFGDVMHARLKPMGHRFSYRVMSVLLDLDRLPEADRQSRLFGINRSAIYSFHEKDHGERDGSPLNAYVRRHAMTQGVDLDGGRILLLCYPRLFGYTFNPLSVYFCYDKSGELTLVIYEVRNTFGAIHSYVLPVSADQRSAAGIRQEQDKLFYVSPFVEMQMRYHFRVAPPDDEVKLRILETDSDGPLLSATFHGKRRALTMRSLLGSLFALPLVTFKIVAAIHWEALRLWLKGATLVPEAAAKSAEAGVRPARAPSGSTESGARISAGAPLESTYGHGAASN